MVKIRKNFTLSRHSITILEAIKKQTKLPLSQLIETAILQTYQDPVLALKSEARKLFIKAERLKRRADKIEEERIKNPNENIEIE